ncbi:peptidase M22 glycoprotease [Wolfiporia cocos MD-104 SS10]|uniref:N(6)-L-threonylcarbamoyladenine synthase n=1 Tax=Wolfiporia cocos (strain MD-104) TaxID=742152 RepID=A0A2H3JMV6_WOLCO|nr:peptidase M22 glycoprotease [Wolfiporia cocos MD-104 SS10]
MCDFAWLGEVVMLGTGDDAVSREAPFEAESLRACVRTCSPPGEMRWIEGEPEAEDNSFSDKNPSLFDGWGSALALPALTSALLAPCSTPPRGIVSSWLDERRRSGTRMRMLLRIMRSYPASLPHFWMNGYGTLTARFRHSGLKAGQKICSRGPYRQFTVLAVESSADDTCAAVVTSDRQILSNVVVRQDNYHESFGGIHPYVAIKAHQRNMPNAVKKALEEANLAVSDVDGVAFTQGPGIAGCLSVGANAAKTLAAALNKPLVGVHHMQAHALTPFLTTPTEELPQYPFLTLLISGGHTLLLLATSPRTFRTLATTVDESIGRVFDKVSRMLSLPWNTHGPGAALEAFVKFGPPAEQLVAHAEGQIEAPEFSIPMRGRLAFSYTGPHSAVERFLHARGGIVNDTTRYEIASRFQRAAVGQLEEKLALGLEACRQKDTQIRHLVVSGGVASNLFLRERLRVCLDKASPNVHISLVFPPPSLCTDNAVMIAWASMSRFLNGDTDDYTIDLRSKWSIEELDSSGPDFLETLSSGMPS